LTFFHNVVPSTGLGCPSSVRISILSEVPAIPDQAPNTKYNVPMSLGLLEKNHWVKISGVAENNNQAMGCKSIAGRLRYSSTIL